jgi:chromosome segregation ATPase
LLEVKVAENMEAMNNLRQERSLLTANHRELQTKFAKVSDVCLHLLRLQFCADSIQTVNKLRQEQTTSQSSHDDRRQQLDLQLAEIEDLRRALATKTDELENARARHDGAQDDVARTVAALEADLKRVRREAETFGRDLGRLRAERDRLQELGRKGEEDARRAKDGEKKARDEVDDLIRRVGKHKDEARRVRQELDGHVCAAYVLQDISFPSYWY